MSTRNAIVLLLAVAGAVAPLSPARGEEPPPGTRRKPHFVQVTEEVQQALDRLERAAKEHPDDAEAQARWGFALAKAGKVEQGIAVLAAAAAIDPEDPRVMLYQAKAFSLARRYDEAEDMARRAAESPLATPKLASEAWRVLGSLHWLANRPPEAEKAFRRSIELDPRNSGALYNLGNLLYGQGRKGEGLSFIEKAIRRDPRNVRALVAVARIYDAMGRWEDARQAWSRAADLATKDANVQFVAGVAELRARHWEAAEKRLRRAVELDPTDANAHLALANALLREGRWDEAETQAKLAGKLGADARKVLDAIRFERSQAPSPVNRGER